MASSKVKSGNSLVVVPFNLPSDLSSQTVGQNITLATLADRYDGYGLIGIEVYVYGQERTITGFFDQFALAGSAVLGVTLKMAFSSGYNNAPASLILYK